LKIIEFIRQHKAPAAGFLLSLFVSLITLTFSVTFPEDSTEKFQKKNSKLLNKKERLIQEEFTGILDEIQARKSHLLASPFPEESEKIFSLFKTHITNPEIEGIAYSNSFGDVLLWFGNVAEVKDVFLFDRANEILIKKPASFLLQDKVSSYLVNIDRIDTEHYVILYRLLAFQPEMKSSYLTAYHFLKAQLLKNCDIFYWDYREDISGFENFFGRHNDKYTGEPTSPDNIATLIFPLKNEEGRIAATITISSPPMSADISSRQDDFLFLFFLSLGSALVFFTVLLLKIPLIKQKRHPLVIISVIAFLLGIRVILFPLSELESIQNLAVFSPSSSSFLSFWNFTKSPADTFLTAVCLFLIVGYLLLPSNPLSRSKKKKYGLFSSLGLVFISLAFSFVLMYLFQKFLHRLILNSNLNLLRISFNPSFILIHLSILLTFLVALLCIWTCLKYASVFVPNTTVPLVLFFILGTVYVGVVQNRMLVIAFLQSLVILMCLIGVFFPNPGKRKEYLFSIFFLTLLLVYSSLESSFSLRQKLLLQNSLKNTIESQKSWGTFVLRQSLPEIDLQEESIHSFFESDEPSDLAHTLWGRTLLSKFNWYSSLELLNPNGTILSRFSLNVPEYYRLQFELPGTFEWIISNHTVSFLGRQKEFLIAYKDFQEEGLSLGRMIISLSLDYDMLPFLYSANPYFELLRISSLPSLNEFDFGFAVFDADGRLLFNPYNIASGIPPDLLQGISENDGSQWSSFKKNKKNYSSYFFKDGNKIYSLFTPKENFLDYAVEYFELSFLYLFFFAFLSLIYNISIKGKKIKNPFWSFSSRVYISFVIIALVPLLLFTLFTREFVNRIFTQQITEKAEFQAEFAQRVMDDIFYTQQEDQLSLTLPADDVVFWISSAIANDVNLYLDGKLLSSSRREFFDYGLLPEQINGEVYYRILYDNLPYFTETQKIGNYSFQILTIPYFIQDNLLLISLPFPLQQQEISEASMELIEFLILISVFFIAAVLLFARGIGGMIITPIRKLLTGTKEVGLGNLEITIPYKRRDEMKTLFDGFNTMIRNLKQHQQDLADMSKKVAWAEMARKVAHEIKNPLTPIQLSAEHLLNVYEDSPDNFEEALKESTSYIIKEVENLRKIAHQFLETSQESVLQKDLLDLKDIVKEAIDPYRKILPGRIQIVERYTGEDFRFRGDKVKIKIALRNIIINAIEAIQNEGTVSFSVHSSGSTLKLSIADTGIGIGKEVLDRIFDPYFSTKDVGTGLGLPIAKKIINDHRGSIEAEGQENRGTLITIFLPRVTDV